MTYFFLFSFVCFSLSLSLSLSSLSPLSLSLSLARSLAVTASHFSFVCLLFTDEDERLADELNIDLSSFYHHGRLSAVLSN